MRYAAHTKGWSPGVAVTGRGSTLSQGLLSVHHITGLAYGATGCRQTRYLQYTVWPIYSVYYGSGSCCRPHAQAPLVSGSHLDYVWQRVLLHFQDPPLLL